MTKRRTALTATIVALLLAGVAGVALAMDSGSSASRPVPAGTAAPKQAATDAHTKAAISAGQKFLDEYVDPDGRVVRHDQGGDTVSEGQAYAMLIAVAVNDRPRFDAIWKWTQDNLQRPDKLFSFQWVDHKVINSDPATDADLDTSRALLIAATRWNEPALKAAAIEIGNSILLRETVDVSKRKVLVAGPWARATPAIVNPSYFSPRAYTALYAATGDRRWQELQDTSLEAIDGLTTNAPSLPPDWARVHGTQIVPSYAPNMPVTGVRYAYEAARVMPRYAEMCPVTDNDPDAQTSAIGRRLVARSWPFFKSLGPDGPTADLRADGRALGGNKNALSTVAAASAADSAGDYAARDQLFDRAQEIQNLGLNYYGGAWIALGRIMLTTDLLGACNSPGGIQ